MVSTEQLLELYYEQAQNQEQLGQSLGISAWSAWNLLRKHGIPGRNKFVTQFFDLAQDPDFPIDMFMTSYVRGTRLRWNVEYGTPYWTVESSRRESLEELAYYIEWEAGIVPSIIPGTPPGEKLEIYGFRRCKRFAQRFDPAKVGEMVQALKQKGITWESLPQPHRTPHAQLSQVLHGEWMGLAQLERMLGWKTENTYSVLKTAAHQGNVQIESIGHKLNRYRWIGIKPWHLRLAYGVYRGAKFTVQEMVHNYAQSLGSEAISMGPAYMPQYVFPADCNFCFFDVSSQPNQKSVLDIDFVLAVIGPDFYSAKSAMDAFDKRLRGKNEYEGGARLIRPPFDVVQEMRILYAQNPAAIEDALFAKQLVGGLRAKYDTPWKISEGALRVLSKIACNQAMVVHYLMTQVNPFPRSLVRENDMPPAYVQDDFLEWRDTAPDVLAVYK